MSTHEMQHQTAGHDGGSGEEEPFDVMDIVAARSRGDLEAQSADMKKEQRSVAQLVVDQATEPEVISGPGPIPLVNRSITDRPNKEGFEQDERKTNEGCGSTSKDAQQELCKFETRQRGSTTRRQSQAMARPGAYAVEPSATEQSETMTPIGVDSLTSSNTSTIVEDGLAVANPVDDDAVRHLSLPQARDFDAVPVASNRSKQKTKQFLRALLSGTILLIVVLLILLSVAALVPKRTATTASPAPSPSTPAPTSAKGYLLSLFDDGTQQALEDPQSPQSRSYEWILEDLDNLPLYSDDQIKQKFALASLYFATGGDNWRNNTNWLNHSVSECNWFFNPEFARKSAISQLLPGYLAGFLEPPPTSPCDNDGLLQHLWLDQNNLEGSIPEELYLLTKLETLSMGWNQLGGTISSHIGQLRALEGLTLSQLLLTGTLPTEVGMLSNLRFFSLHANQLQGDLPTQIWQLTNLVDLILSSNSELKGTLPTDIGALSKLRMLQLERSDFSGTIPTELGQAESLGWKCTK
ncbi:Leucine Rich Repeat [Seminavis robusta]|uniref:Leucine Rich Repeat n=1 Tax=Seminavis robusta TaxID=568900 RepID=A0A9N8DDI6_9STRA|nr:Leucine Rich Repeat [Seminavis robusta]|eukprot:Sro45_g026870.1 Leucine Rich Repeat (523) ;mRNA; r:30009-31763